MMNGGELYANGSLQSSSYEYSDSESEIDGQEYFTTMDKLKATFSHVTKRDLELEQLKVNLSSS